MEAFDQLGLDLTALLAPWIAIIISLSAVFWFKDFATNLMSGLKFKMNSAFNPIKGDPMELKNMRLWPKVIQVMIKPFPAYF